MSGNVYELIRIGTMFIQAETLTLMMLSVKQTRWFVVVHGLIAIICCCRHRFRYLQMEFEDVVGFRCTRDVNP